MFCYILKESHVAKEEKDIMLWSPGYFLLILIAAQKYNATGFCYRYHLKLIPGGTPVLLVELLQECIQLHYFHSYHKVTVWPKGFTFSLTASAGHKACCCVIRVSCFTLSYMKGEIVFLLRYVVQKWWCWMHICKCWGEEPEGVEFRVSFNSVGLILSLFVNAKGSCSSHKCKESEIQSKSESSLPHWWNPSLKDLACWLL